MSDALIRCNAEPDAANNGPEALRRLAAALGRQAARELFRAATGAPAVPPPQADVAALEEDEHVPRRD